MAYKHETFALPNFLASSAYQNFTEQTTESLQKGVVFKKNGKTVGLVFEDVTVDDPTDPQPVSVMYQGWVNAALLPIALSDDDKAALRASGIHFRFEEDGAATSAAATPAK